MSLGFYKDDIILWPNFGNGMISICVGPSWVIWKIFVKAQNNLWGLYEKYLSSSNWVIIWGIFVRAQVG